MYPVLFTIPGIDYPISTFGIMMALGFLAGYWLTSRRMAEEGFDPEPVTNILVWIMLGGVLGSKLYYAVDVSIREGYPFSELLFARAGITWYGGLMGGTLAGILGCRRYGVPALDFSNWVAPGLAVGQALGRIGCFLVGDDYGKVTDVPWAVSFPLGAPPIFETVHPTQLYEVVWLLPVALFLWRRRKRSPFLLGEYFALNGSGRLVIEHWRVNEQVLFGLTEPQLIGLALIGIGGGLWLHHRGKNSTRAALP